MTLLATTTASIIILWLRDIRVLASPCCFSSPLRSLAVGRTPDAVSSRITVVQSRTGVACATADWMVAVSMFTVLHSAASALLPDHAADVQRSRAHAYHACLACAMRRLVVCRCMAYKHKLVPISPKKLAEGLQDPSPWPVLFVVSCSRSPFDGSDEGAHVGFMIGIAGTFLCASALAYIGYHMAICLGHGGVMDRTHPALLFRVRAPGANGRKES